MRFGHYIKEEGKYFISEDYKPKTREQAQKDKDTLYFEKNCENNHHAPRYTRDNVCKECYRLKRKAQLEKRMKKLKEAEDKKSKKKKEMTKKAAHITTA